MGAGNRTQRALYSRSMKGVMTSFMKRPLSSPASQVVTFLDTERFCIHLHFQANFDS